MPPPRMTANPKRPSRYRPGKGQDQDSDSEYETEEEIQTNKDKPKAKPRSTQPATNKVTGAFQEVTLSASKPQGIVAKAQIINEDEFETESEDEAEEQPKNSTANHAPRIAQTNRDSGESEEEDEDEDEEEEGSSEEDEDDSETSSEDEAPKKLLRPTFIRKDQRASTATATDQGQSEAHVVADIETRRKEKADALVQEQLERNMQLKLAEKKAWDDSDNEGGEGKTEAEVDDTDGLDPEAELAAWKLRELKRVKRSREQIETAEKEREEIERRRNLTKEERDAEDAQHIAAQEEEREGKGKAGYMQRYFHRGAFFQDSEYAEEAGLKGRDIMGSKFADQVNNREALPEFMQIRDMAKLGRKGRTRYKDLKSEDTGRWGEFGRGGGGNRNAQDAGMTGMTGGSSNDILDERFRPDDDRNRHGHGHGPSGANATSISNTSRRDQPRRSSPARISNNTGADRKRRYSSVSDRRSRSRSRSRSGSPSHRERKHRSERHRSRSRSRSRSPYPPPSRRNADHSGKDSAEKRRAHEHDHGRESESRFDKRVRVS